MNRIVASVLVFSTLTAACVGGPEAGDEMLQDAVSFMVAIGQHGEGADTGETLARLDQEIARSPNDPYVLKIAAMTRASLAENLADRTQRRQLRTEALVQLSRAAAMAQGHARPRQAIFNGLPYDVDFDDVAELSANIAAAEAADR